MNALRLNLAKIHDPSHDRKRKKALNIPADGKLLTGEEQGSENITEERGQEMEKTMKIEGMMCEHCEARVKKTLEALDQVEEAVVSHEAGTAIVKLNEQVDDAVLTKAVEDQDYKVLGID